MQNKKQSSVGRSDFTKCHAFDLLSRNRITIDEKMRKIGNEKWKYYYHH